MNVLAACLSLAVFMVLLKLLRVDSNAADALAISRRATRMLRNPRLGDDVKEKMARRYSLRLLARFFGIAVPGVISGAVAFGLLVLMDRLKMASLDGTLAIMTGWIFVAVVLVASVVVFGVVTVWRRRQIVRHEV